VGLRWDYGGTMVVLWWDYGGETEGERWACGIIGDALKCAILAHFHLLALNVNQQSLS
jgi:hypothetical protein